MKQILKYALITSLAVLIFYGGAGVNFVTYCCNGCFETGIKNVAVKECCSTAGETYEQTGSDILFTKAHDCGIERIEFNWTTVYNENSAPLEPIFTDILCDNNLSISSTPLLSLNLALLDSDNNSPPIRLPRQYLTFLSTLLI